VGPYILEGSKIEARRGGGRLLALAPHDPARPQRLRRADARLAAHRARILRASGALGRRRAGLWRDSSLSPAAHHRQATRHQYRLLPGHRAGWRDWRAPTRSTGESSRASRLARAPTVTRSRFFLSRTIFERSSYSSSAIAPLLEHAGIDPAEYRQHGLFVLRATWMSPYHLLAAETGHHQSLLAEFMEKLGEKAQEAIRALASV